MQRLQLKSFFIRQINFLTAAKSIIPRASHGRSPLHLSNYHLHLDYWPGNVLWDQGRITAVVDWEEAAFGDPGIDVAYCRMEMCLSDLGHAAGEFLSTYEAQRRRPVANLAHWELAAAARPMFSPEGWITESPAKEAFRDFINNARMRSGDG